MNDKQKFILTRSAVDELSLFNSDLERCIDILNWMLSRDNHIFDLDTKAYILEKIDNALYRIEESRQILEGVK